MLRQNERTITHKTCKTGFKLVECILTQVKDSSVGNKTLRDQTTSSFHSVFIARWNFKELSMNNLELKRFGCNQHMSLHTS